MSTEPNLSLDYRCSTGEACTLEGCTLTVDKAGRYWLWSEQLQENLSWHARTRDECFLDAIGSLLFTIQLRDERIKELQRIADLAAEFADKVRPDED